MIPNILVIITTIINEFFSYAGTVLKTKHYYKIFIQELI